MVSKLLDFLICIYACVRAGVYCHVDRHKPICKARTACRWYDCTKSIEIKPSGRSFVYVYSLSRW